MKCGQVRQPGSWARAAEAKMLFLEKDQAGLGIWAWPLPNSHQPRIQSGSLWGEATAACQTQVQAVEQGGNEHETLNCSQYVEGG